MITTEEKEDRPVSLITTETICESDTNEVMRMENVLPPVSPQICFYSVKHSILSTYTPGNVEIIFSSLSFSIVGR